MVLVLWLRFSTMSEKICAETNKQTIFLLIFIGFSMSRTHRFVFFFFHAVRIRFGNFKFFSVRSAKESATKIKRWKKGVLSNGFILNSIHLIAYEKEKGKQKHIIPRQWNVVSEGSTWMRKWQEYWLIDTRTPYAFQSICFNLHRNSDGLKLKFKNIYSNR